MQSNSLLSYLTAASITLMVSFTILAGAIPSAAEDGVLRLHVTNPSGRAIDGVTIGPNGAGTPGKTKDGGRTSIQLPSQAKEFDAIKLQIIGGTGGLDFVSPWDHVVVIPSFKNDPSNFAEIVLAPHGSISMLKHERTVRALASAVTYGASTGMASDQQASGSRRSRLDLVARDYGLDPDALDKAIREWGQHAHTAEDRALAKMYAQQYEGAAVDFAEAIHEQNEIEQRARLKKAELLAESGLNLYLAGKPTEAAVAYEDSFRINPDDPTMLNNYGLVLKLQGENDKASDKFQRALVAGQRLWGADDLQVVPIMNNVAQSLLADGKGDEAIAKFQQGLQIRRAKLAASDVRVAMSLTDIGAVYVSLDRCHEAEPLLNEALGIFDRSLASTSLLQAPAPPMPAKSLVIPEGRQRRQPQQQQMTIPTRREKKEQDAQRQAIEEMIRQKHESQAKDRFDAGQPSISVVYLSLALCTDNIDNRKQLLRSALREAESQFGEGHLETTYSMVALGRFLRDYGTQGTQSGTGRHHPARSVDEKSEGIELLKRALAIRMDKLGPENDLTVSLKKEIDDAHE